MIKRESCSKIASKANRPFTSEFIRLIDLRIGEAVTLLRPAGKAEFGGVTLDVVTSGEFLPKGARVQVVRAEGLRILVRAANAE